MDNVIDLLFDDDNENGVEGSVFDPHIDIDFMERGLSHHHHSRTTDEGQCHNQRIEVTTCAVNRRKG